MQLNPLEMRLLQGASPTQQMPAMAFQLPSIGAAVPHYAEIVNREIDYSTITKSLLEAEVIDPEMISTDASTPKCILEQGLKAWFKERTERIKFINFDVHIFDAVSASEIQHAYSDDEPHVYEGWVFALSGHATSELRCAERIAVELETKCPGLFYTAFSAMERAGWKSIGLRTPLEIIESTASWMLWEGDLSEIPTDADAMEYLVDRYGDEAERYLPSTLMKVWGEGFCLPRKGQKAFPNRKINKLCKSDDHQVSAIAQQLVKLREAAQYVSECGAEMPGLENVQGDQLFTGCAIAFNTDDRYTEWIDAHVNGMYESGEYTEFLQIGELPSAPDELDSYFLKLDAMFRLIAEIDALIPLLTYSGNAD